MNRTDIAGISRTLRADMRLKTIYEIICNYGDTEAAVWLENGQQKTRTFTEYARLTRSFAAALRGEGIVGRDAAVVVEADDLADGPQLFQILIRLYRHNELIPCCSGMDPGLHPPAIIMGFQRATPFGRRRLLPYD